MDDSNSPIFDAYSAYYDLFYGDKDYAGEARYVHALIQKYCGGATNVLELGCGTGGHAAELSKLGYCVTGIDRSESMIARARRRAECVNTKFIIGDLRDCRSDRQYDVVVALFHVMSYQVVNDDLAAAFATAAHHLRPGGVFIFDCWYGPGVISAPPATRVRRLRGDGFKVTRIAESTAYPNKNRVDVRYEVLVERGGSLDRISETHAMRYLFAPEMELYARSVGLHSMKLLKWLGDAEPGFEDWNACFVAHR